MLHLGNTHNPTNTVQETIRLMPRGIKTQIINTQPLTDYDEMALDWFRRHNMLNQRTKQLRWSAHGTKVTHQIRKNHTHNLSR